MNRSINIKDIAAAAHVSPATVARVIGNNGYVSEKKRAMVQKVADELGYVPNKVASGLRRRQTNLIGHVLPVSTENPFFARICSAFESAAAQAGFHVLTAITRMDPAHEKDIVENLLSQMVEAIVFTATKAGDTTLINWVISRKIPVVMIERERQVSNIDAILIDNFRGAGMAVEHMISKGHRDIGFIGLMHDVHEVERQRYFGYSSALTSNGIPINTRWIKFIPDYFAEHGRAAMTELINAGTLPTALFVTSDVTASGVLQVLYEHSIRVPEDISIVGYDNTLSLQSSPPLTTIDLQMEQIGSMAVEMIIERIQKSGTEAKRITLTPILVDRSSVATVARD